MDEEIDLPPNLVFFSSYRLNVLVVKFGHCNFIKSNHRIFVSFKVLKLTKCRMSFWNSKQNLNKLESLENNCCYDTQSNSNGGMLSQSNGAKMLHSWIKTHFFLNCSIPVNLSKHFPYLYFTCTNDGLG